MKIGELARRARMSRSTLHYYRGLGLLQPPRRLGPKLHLYGAAHLERLSRVRALRAEGLSLDEIRAQLRGEPAATVGEADDVRAEIVDEATRQFLSRGYDAMRMADLAAAVRMSKTTLYQHFDGKQALFVECITRLRQRIFPPTPGARPNDASELQQRAYERTRELLGDFEPFDAMQTLLHSALAQGDPTLASVARRELHAIAADSVPALREAMDAGLVRRLDPEAVSYMLFGAVMWIGKRMQADPELGLDSALAVYWDVMSRGILEPQP